MRKVTASGYIEERLKTLRSKLSPSKKPHKKHVFRTLLADTPQADDMEAGFITFEQLSCCIVKVADIEIDGSVTYFVGCKLFFGHKSALCGCGWFKNL